MKTHKLAILGLGISLFLSASNENNAQTSASAENQELPKILYVVPWKDSRNKKTGNPKLVLHNLMGDLYEPQLASDWQSR
jgi:hypothetical protein